MSPWNGLDRRKFPRVKYPCMIVVRGEDNKEMSFLTHTENLGAGGVCVILKKQVKLFAPVEVEIDLMDMQDHVRCSGKVVWSVRRKDETADKPMFYDMGIEFEGLTEQDQGRIAKLVKQIAQQRGRVIPYS